MEICNHIMEKSMRLIAKQQIHNVIIDQCNVLLKARLKKLRIFKNFQKKAFVLVVSDSDQRKRMLKRERQILNQNQMYPKLCLESFRNLQEHFVIPTKEEGFSEIEYIEIDEEISQRIAFMNNLVAVHEVHPLLKPYDFKRVKAVKDAQEKQKLLDQQKLQQQMLQNQQMLPPNNLIPGQPISSNQQGGVPAGNQQGLTQFAGQQANQQQGSEQRELNVENQNPQEQFDEEQQEGNENYQQENSNEQEDYEQNQEDSMQDQDQWDQNNNYNQEDMENQDQDEGDDQMMDDQQNE